MNKMIAVPKRELGFATTATWGDLRGPGGNGGPGGRGSHDAILDRLRVSCPVRRLAAPRRGHRALGHDHLAVLLFRPTKVPHFSFLYIGYVLQKCFYNQNFVSCRQRLSVKGGIR